MMASGPRAALGGSSGSLALAPAAAFGERESNG